MNLTNRCIFITGGTSGIGQAFAKAFYERGNQVIICGRRTDRLAEMEAAFPGMITRLCDLAVPEERAATAKWVIENHPEVDILMNNAGVQLTADLSKPVDLKRIHLEIETNMVAPIDMASHFAEHLSSKEEAAVINISSGLAFVPISFMPVYCATKAAIHSLTLSMRHQYRHTNIKVFEVAPPAVDTELGHDRRTNPNESHGGMPVQGFLEEAIQALEQDLLEAPIAMAKGLRSQGEAMFGDLNPA